MITLLSIIHASNTKNFGERKNGELDFDETCRNDCFIHDHFGLNLRYKRMCLCGRTFPEENL